MYIKGILVGAGSFLLCGLFHVIVVKAEYYFTKKCWPVFAALGILCCLTSLFTNDPSFSCFCAVAGFTSLWSIKELYEQEERVRKGWFPANPNRRRMA